ncbi:hypothetical protein D3C76_02040 [compost metagenome]
MKINIKLWYRDGSGKEIDMNDVRVEYVPDSIYYKNSWWDKSESCLDLNDGTYTKIHYSQKQLPNGGYYLSTGGK